MLYQSLKLTNGIWVLAELRIQPGNPNFMVRAPLPPCHPGASVPGSLSCPPPGPGAALMEDTRPLCWSPFEAGVTGHQNAVPIKDLRKLSTQSHQVTQIRHHAGSRDSELDWTVL